MEVRDEAQAALERWVGMLAADDPTFAATSAVHSATDRSWQSATYLLTGDPELWRHFRLRVLRDRSLDVVLLEALALYGLGPDRKPSSTARPERWWRPAQSDVLVWTAFCWTDQWFAGPAVLPRGLSPAMHDRWLRALWIHKDHAAPPPGLL